MMNKPPIINCRCVVTPLPHRIALETRRALLRSRIQQCKRRVQAAHTELNLALAYEHRVMQRGGPALVSDLCVWAVSAFIVLAVLALANRAMVAA